MCAPTAVPNLRRIAICAAEGGGHHEWGRFDIGALRNWHATHCRGDLSFGSRTAPARQALVRPHAELILPPPVRLAGDFAALNGGFDWQSLVQRGFERIDQPRHLGSRRVVY